MSREQATQRSYARQPNAGLFPVSSIDFSYKTIKQGLVFPMLVWLVRRPTTMHKMFGFVAPKLDHCP